MSTSKQEMRQQLRAARNSIAPPQRDSDAANLCATAIKLPYLANAKAIALYWPIDDEINCLPLMNHCLEQGKNCFLPVLLVDPHQKLAFASYTPQTPLVKNRYGILEPELNFSAITRLLDLDIIFVPLVGFDKQGRRLGRGGGFYDATFADLNKYPHSKWPKLEGLAYSCQYIDEIPTDGWDWQLDAVITETDIYSFK
jgi:5-formyltetrahydrofolate cyclo-ligase